MKAKMIYQTKPYLIVFLGLALIQSLTSCASLDVKKTLEPENKEFLSKVRYIITKKERRAFLLLPSEERKAFVEEFWKMRDPDPFTEINEFKEMHFERIKMANILFTTSGVPGWLQDRGRAYILLGPPKHRLTSPGYYDRWSERWFYKDFQIDFVFGTIMGVFELDTRSISNLTKFVYEQSKGIPKIKMEKTRFDYELEIFKENKEDIAILVKVPFTNIWLKESEGTLETLFKVSLWIEEEKGEKVIWEHKNDFPLSIKKSNFRNSQDKNYVMRIPAKLHPGIYILTILVENSVGEAKVQKKIRFNI